MDDKSLGAVTVTVSLATSDGDGAMRNEITAVLNAKFGVSSPTALANHVMMCMPPGTMSGLAYAYIGGWRSVYSDNWYVTRSVTFTFVTSISISPPLYPTPNEMPCGTHVVLTLSFLHLTHNIIISTMYLLFSILKVHLSLGPNARSRP